MKNKCKLKRIFSIPHINTAIIILGSAIITLIISGVLHLLECSFWSSIFANVFAGLITGLIICMISGIKQKSISDINAKITWLQELSGLIKVYFSDYNKLTRLKFDKFNCDENLYILFSDADVHANDVNSAILQKQFDETFDYSPCQYVKEHLNYDAEKLTQDFRALHEKVGYIDISCPSSKEIVSYFNDVDKELHKLNFAVCREIRELEKKLIKIQKAII